MRYLLIFFTTIGLVNISFGQHIKIISAYDNESSYTSGLYAMQDTAVYRYSWYYQEWFPLENNGLTRVGNTVKLSSLAVYNNKTGNSSGIFVFSDTVVLNYNWITATWYPLLNTGLPRISNKPDVRMLTVYGDSGSSSNSTLFALSDTAVYRYNWYYQEWYSLANTGLSNFLKEVNRNINFNAIAFPNPFENNLTIKLQLPEGDFDKIKVAIFDEKGTMLKYFEQNVKGEKEVTVLTELSNFPAGLFFCEIKAGSNYKTIRVIRKN
jgi:hypothetical protein